MRRLVIRLAILLVVLWCAVFAPTGRAEQARANLDTDIAFFYKQPSPERVAQILTNFNKSTLVEKPSAHPPMIGFLAAASQKYPNDIDKMIPADETRLNSDSMTCRSCLRSSATSRIASLLDAALGMSSFRRATSTGLVR